MSSPHEALIRRLYAGFNARDIDAVLASLSPDVAWANGMSGGHVQGHEAVREYWTQQWTTIDPHVEPMRVEARGEDAVEVEVHQVVHDLEGALLLDETVTHVFQINEERVTRFDIEQAGGLSSLTH